MRAEAALARLRCDHLAQAQMCPEERALQEEVAEVVAREVRPRAAAVDRDGIFAAESYQALAAAGLGGVNFPVSLGGRGLSTVAYVAAMEEVAAACGATSLVYMTQAHAAYPVLLAGTTAQREAYVPPLLDGRHYGAIAITEPAAGSDAASLRTRAHDTGRGYALTGSKTFITTGDRADRISCFATVDPSARQAGITAFVLHGTDAGLSRGAPMHKMGMHGSSTAELFLDKVEIPYERRLGAVGCGWAVLGRCLDKSRLSAAAQGLGLARGALEQLVCGVASGAVHDDGVFWQELATAVAELSAARALLHSVARMADAVEAAGPGDRVAGPLEVSVGASQAKLVCTDLGFRTATAAMRLAGPVGDLPALGIERYARDVKVTQIYDGANEIQRTIIGRSLQRLPEGTGLEGTGLGDAGHGGTGHGPTRPGEAGPGATRPGGAGS